ncbi:MAG: SCO family protein [Rhodanobacteraceae bacterium]
MSKHRFALRWFLPLCALLFLSACASQSNWQLDDVQGHMPNLEFHLTNDLGQHVTAANYRGKVVMLYFGYTHCPDVCPLTMAHLHTVLEKIGKRAASHVQVLFVTVDPARDTVPVLRQYVAAFDPRFQGLRGDQGELAPLVKRYRAIYQIVKPIPANGDYLVTHSATIYIFDPQDRIRLIATPSSTVDEMAHDVGLLVKETT